MNFIEKILFLYKKDLVIEFRTKITLTSILFFAFLVLLIFNFGFSEISSNANYYAPGVLWITFSFSGVLALSRIFEHEKDRWAIKGLISAPLDKLCIYFSKFLLHFTLMILMEAVALLLFLVLFNPSWSVITIIKIFSVTALATVGFSGLGVIVSSMLFNERLKELLLPITFYPLVVPLIIIAVKSTEGIISDGSFQFVTFMLGFDIVFVVASAMLYDFVLEGN